MIFRDIGAAVKPAPTEYDKADQYAPGTRIVSKFTRRQGVVKVWPGDREQMVGTIWVKWDDGAEHHAWRHQVNRA